MKDQNKNTIEVTPRKGWSPGYLTTDDIAKFYDGKLTIEDLQKLETKRKHKDIRTKHDKN